MTEEIIYKWGPLDFYSIPIKGHLVHVGIQNGDVFVWTKQEVNLNIRYNEYFVRLHPTGEKYTGEYHGTVITTLGFVWHVIEDREP